MATYVFNPFTGTFDLASGGANAGDLIREDRIITNQEALDQELTLSVTPLATSEVDLIFTNGPAQANGFDYAVSGSVLSWSGLALELTITGGERIILRYQSA